jgi:hypothetical protein
MVDLLDDVTLARMRRADRELGKMSLQTGLSKLALVQASVALLSANPIILKTSNDNSEPNG